MKNNVFRFLTSSLALAALTACGGGGGGSSGAAVPTTSTPIAGTAAVGKAIGGGTVTAKCATGSASTVSAADGSFSLSTSMLTAPCLLQISFGVPVQRLHSIAVTAGRTNITPITELATALTFSNADLPTLYSTVTNNQLTQAAIGLSGASQRALAALTSQSLAFPTGFDPISGPLVPLSSTQTIGDVHDQLLDSLKLKLAGTGQTIQNWVSNTVAPTTGGGTSGNGFATGLASTYRCSATGTGAASGTVIVDTSGRATLNFQDVTTGAIYSGTGTVAANGTLIASTSGALGSIQGTANYTGTFVLLPGSTGPRGAGQWTASTGTSGSWICVG